MRKINIIDNFEIEIGIKHLISLEAKKEFIKIITSKLNDYKHLKEIFFSVQNDTKNFLIVIHKSVFCERNSFYQRTILCRACG